MMYECFDCGNLNKKVKKDYKESSCYNYGCNAPGRSYTCVSVRKDSELKQQGCSEWRKKDKKPEPKQISLFD